ncbi:hypothetical protein SRIM_036270 [Streptomyces rimosus subsp. rimosus ATCC 10970]|uniref:Uncharacterized protein n=1 Tax=Streptomyces rimosus subsp. rimosus (strain ATCC 10970 / DSM 40260 / JCM 4667 / NRRL 2234) TaxID=1265868 RepID=A0A8A1UWA9_STRR1|nr:MULTISPECIES: hypothetical protein [Streptomyces]MYT45575.1 hypothetical protein [Streptomyces sp. SID5471]QGY67987.1 hypothetical protein V519_020505 [Streptomyces rimosus R6-500]QST84893.1 hypothetical protein SRIM_036270 [Streptomyces rimosus subsp. rimosus ATCC 10970]QTL85162.1 hypothetical protein FMM49_04850 [Streptomyces rimosus subsp. rimosus]
MNHEVVVPCVLLHPLQESQHTSFGGDVCEDPGLQPCGVLDRAGLHGLCRSFVLFNASSEEVRQVRDFITFH